MFPGKRRWQRNVWRAIAALVLLIGVVLGGPQLACSSRGAMLAPTTTPSSGHVLHVVGWGGVTAQDKALLQALRDGGCPHAMETFDWTAGRRALIALWRAQHSSEPPRLLAAKIESLWRERPGRPIFITADSSGCGVTLDALALLRSEVRVQRVILSSPAVSRDYDLAPALAHIDGSIVSFNSEEDDLILGLGTTIFGTVDGRHAGAAGRGGFRFTDPKLEQIAYDPAWLKRYGHDGGHTRALSPVFAREAIAPKLVR